MIIKSQFKAAWWLKNAHLQTIYPTLTRRPKTPVSFNERLELPDGDFLDLAWATEGLSPDSPLVILLHGLGGNVHSSYISGLFGALNKVGFRALLMHFRGASQEPNRLARAYHAGETSDFSYLLQVLHARESQTKKAAIGISLGGNVLLKWLGETPNQSLIQTAVAVSPPFQLELLADQLNKGFGRVYQAHLLKRVRNVHARKRKAFSGKYPFTLNELNALKTFWDFDNLVTAPLHGFTDVHDYYKKVSSRQFLNRITTPTLIIHAIDDPFIPAQAIPNQNELSPFVTLELSETGGHVGFIRGDILGKPIYWLDERIPQYVQTKFGSIA